MKFVWTPEFSVGVKMFDEHHQHWFEMANKIYDLANESVIDKEKLLILITEFGNYALYHLSAEEEFFKEYGYPDSELHIKFHNLHRQKIKEYLEEIQKLQSDIQKIAKDLNEFAEKWLIDHIASMDKKYTSFFNSHGVN